MMILKNAIRELEKRIEGSGCEEGIVALSVDPQSRPCQYDEGACMIASYGGKSAEFVTFEPTRAKTRISFMFGAPVDTPGARAAASAILNAVTGFLCMNRVLRSCSPECHEDCLNELKENLQGKRVAICGSSKSLRAMAGHQLVPVSENPEVILVTGEGIMSGADEALIEKNSHAEVILISPSSSGVAVLGGYPHWCPYGRG